MIIIDDMISSGESMLEVAAALKERKANKIFVFSTFGLFTNGLDKFDKAYENGIIDKVLTTNLIYQTPELLQREWYINCDKSKKIEDPIFSGRCNKCNTMFIVLHFRL